MERRPKELQLQLCGVPSIFDYSNGIDSLVALASDAISINSLDHAGSPRQIFYFDVGLQPRQVFVQQIGHHPVVATINASSFTLFDTSSTSTTLSAIKRFQEDSTYAFDWSPIHPFQFVTASSNGLMYIWDRRTSLNKAAGALYLGPSSVQRISWSPFNDYEVAALMNDKYLLKWDMRMTTDSVDDSPKPKYDVLNCRETVIDFAWRSDTSFWALSSDHICSISSAALKAQYSISVDKDSNVTQSFIWNRARQICAVLLTKKNYPECVVKFFSYGEDGFSPKETITVPSSVKKCFWRRDSEVFVFVFANGKIQLFDLAAKPIVSYNNDAAYSPEDNFTAAILERQRPKNGQTVKHPFHDLKASLAFPDLHSNFWLDPSPREHPSSTVKNVVGPKTFQNMLADELRILELAVKSKILDGMSLVGADAFNRVLIFDYNATATTPGGTGASRAFNFSYNVSTEQNTNIFSLTITFAKKLSHFWNMTFTIDNKSHYKVDAEALYAEFIDEVKKETQTMIASRTRTNSSGAASSSSTTNNSSTNNTSSPSTNMGLPPKPSGLGGSHGGTLVRSRSIDFSSHILFVIARIFREKVHAALDKTVIAERRVSNSLSQSLDKARADLLNVDHEGVTEECLTNKIFRTPFPTLSGGIFNRMGGISLFGNATLDVVLNISGDKPKDEGSQESEVVHSDFVNEIPASVYMSSTTSNDKPVGVKKPRHVSYASLIALRDAQERLKESEEAANQQQQLQQQQQSVSSNLGCSGGSVQQHTEVALPRLRSRPSMETIEESTGEYKEGTHGSIGDAEISERSPVVYRSRSNTGGSANGINARLGRSSSFNTANIAESTLGDTSLALERRVGSQRDLDHMQDTMDDTDLMDDHIDDEERHSTLTDCDISIEGDAQTTNSLTSAVSRDNFPGFPLDDELDKVERHHRSVSIAHQQAVVDSILDRALVPPATQPTPPAPIQAQVKTNRVRNSPSTFPRRLRLATLYNLGDSVQQCDVDVGKSNNNTMVAACRANAQLVSSYYPNDRALLQFWSLFAVALEVLQVADTEFDIIRWNDSALGRNLLLRLMHYLKQRRDLQTWAVVLCVIGGSARLCQLLYGSDNDVGGTVVATKQKTTESRLDPRNLDVALLYYAQLLQAWNLPLHALSVKQVFLSNKETPLQPQQTVAATLPAASSNATGIYQLAVSLGCQTSRHTLLTQAICLMCDEMEARLVASQAMSKGRVPVSRSSENLASRGTGNPTVNLSAKKARGRARQQRITSAAQINNTNSSNTAAGNRSTSSLLKSTSGSSLQSLAEQRVSTAVGIESLRQTMVLPPRCTVPGMQCCVCISVVGEEALLTVCLRCGHGGHDNHLADWFAEEGECPTGCGCFCRYVVHPSFTTQQQKQEENTFLRSRHDSDLGLLLEPTIRNGAERLTTGYYDRSLYYPANTSGSSNMAWSEE